MTKLQSCPVTAVVDGWGGGRCSWFSLLHQFTLLRHTTHPFPSQSHHSTPVCHTIPPSLSPSSLYSATLPTPFHPSHTIPPQSVTPFHPSQSHSSLYSATLYTSVCHTTLPQSVTPFHPRLSHHSTPVCQTIPPPSVTPFHPRLSHHSTQASHTIHSTRPHHILQSVTPPYPSLSHHSTPVCHTIPPPSVTPFHPRLSHYAPCMLWLFDKIKKNEIKRVIHIPHLYGQTHVRVTYIQQIKRKEDIISTNSAIFISFSNFLY